MSFLRSVFNTQIKVKPNSQSLNQPGIHESIIMLSDTFSGRIGIEGAGRMAQKLTEQARGLGFRAPEPVQVQDSREAPPGTSPSGLQRLKFAHGGFYWHKFLDICHLLCHPPPTHRFSWYEIRKLG